MSLLLLGAMDNVSSLGDNEWTDWFELCVDIWSIADNVRNRLLLGLRGGSGEGLVGGLAGGLDAGDRTSAMLTKSKEQGKEREKEVLLRNKNVNKGNYIHVALALHQTEHLLYWDFPRALSETVPCVLHVVFMYRLCISSSVYNLGLLSECVTMHSKEKRKRKGQGCWIKHSASLSRDLHTHWNQDNGSVTDYSGCL